MYVAPSPLARMHWSICNIGIGIYRATRGKVRALVLGRRRCARLYHRSRRPYLRCTSSVSSFTPITGLDLVGSQVLSSSSCQERWRGLVGSILFLGSRDLDLLTERLSYNSSAHFSFAIGRASLKEPDVKELCFWI
jgi:hypothetical protein